MDEAMLPDGVKIELFGHSLTKAEFSEATRRLHTRCPRLKEPSASMFLDAEETEIRKEIVLAIVAERDEKSP